MRTTMTVRRIGVRASYRSNPHAERCIPRLLETLPRELYCIGAAKVILIDEVAV
jgi:hypothetical protein